MLHDIRSKVLNGTNEFINKANHTLVLFIILIFMCSFWAITKMRASKVTCIEVNIINWRQNGVKVSYGLGYAFLMLLGAKTGNTKTEIFKKLFCPTFSSNNDFMQ